MTVPFRSQKKLEGGQAVAPALKAALAPAGTVWLTGWVVKDGGVGRRKMLALSMAK